MVESFIFYNCILICSLSKAVYSVQYISLSSYLDQHDIFQVICLTGGLIDPLHDTFTAKTRQVLGKPLKFLV